MPTHASSMVPTLFPSIHNNGNGNLPQVLQSGDCVRWLRKFCLSQKLIPYIRKQENAKIDTRSAIWTKITTMTIAQPPLLQASHPAGMSGKYFQSRCKFAM